MIHAIALAHETETIENLTPRVKAIMERENITEKQAWEYLKAVTIQHKEEALADDMEYYVMINSVRLKAINSKLEAIEIDEQAEQHRATTLYEQGLRHY